LDVDTLLVRDPRPALNAISGSVLFTTKDSERYPVNTGVMIVRHSAIPKLLTLWRTDTMRVLKDKTLLAQSQSADYPYGAPDQLSFYHLADYQTGATDYTITALDGEKLTTTAIDCARFNQTNSVPITDDMYIAHYKSTWQKILLDGQPFNDKRPREASWELFRYYLQTHHHALKKISDTQHALFAITTPPYVADIAGTFTFDEVAYQTVLDEWQKGAGRRQLQSLWIRAVKKIKKILGI
jgi:hypothetical protein